MSSSRFKCNVVYHCSSAVEESSHLLTSGRVEGASSVELDVEIGITVGHGAQRICQVHLVAVRQSTVDQLSGLRIVEAHVRHGISL